MSSANRQRSLRHQLRIAAGIFVSATIFWGGWAALMLARLGSAIDETMTESREVFQTIVALTNALEREDDVFVLVRSGRTDRFADRLVSQRKSFDRLFDQLRVQLGEPARQQRLETLRGKVQDYRAAGDRLVRGADAEERMLIYHQSVNPALRSAIEECHQILGFTFRSIQETGIRARDVARRGTLVVIGISMTALLISAIASVRLSRAVLTPMKALTSGLHSIRQGEFGFRVPPSSLQEFRELADGFNQMAATLDEYRQSSLGELLLAKNTLESTIASIPSAVILVDPEARVASANPLGSQVLEGNRWDGSRPLFERKLPPRIRQPLAAALRGGAPSHGGSDLSRAADISIGGRPRKVLVTVAPIPHFDGRDPGAVIVLDDVTDLARLDELRSELVAIASHELKTPLTTLRMNLLLLREQERDLSPRQREMLGSAIAGTDELAATIEEMLDLTRIESGQLTLSPESLDLNLLIEESVRSLQPRFDDLGLSVRANATSWPMVVHVDPVRLKLVLANLLGNAVKYSPRGGGITIGVRTVHGTDPSRAGRVELAVTDEGPGIPEELRERVFEKFFRVEQVRPDVNRGVRGTGIGLFLCRQIIEAHGGRIWCAEGPGGRGLRVAFRLPSPMPSPRSADRGLDEG